MAVHKEIEALNTKVQIFISYTDYDKKTVDKIKLIEKTLTDFEKKFSRFRFSSELGRLNNSTNKEFKVSKEMLDLIFLSKYFYEKTNGIFDPTVATALNRLGYDKSFELLEKRSETKPEARLKSESFTELKIDKKKSLIFKPENMKLDFGGIGKGYIIDKINKELSRSGYNNFWISAGGDIFLKGTDEDGNAWNIGVQNPMKHNKDLLIIKCIGDGEAIATSGITKRVWGNKKDGLHHIINPKNMMPVKNDILSVTVISHNIISADVFAKTALILGKQKGLDFINNEKDSECIMVDRNLNIYLSKNMNKYLTENV